MLSSLAWPATGWARSWWGSAARTRAEAGPGGVQQLWLPLRIRTAWGSGSRSVAVRAMLAPPAQTSGVAAAGRPVAVGAGASWRWVPQWSSSLACMVQRPATAEIRSQVRSNPLRVGSKQWRRRHSLQHLPCQRVSPLEPEPVFIAESASITGWESVSLACWSVGAALSS